MEVAAVAQKLSQEHLQCLSATRYKNDMEDRPENTTVTGGVVVRAIVKM